MTHRMGSTTPRPYRERGRREVAASAPSPIPSTSRRSIRGVAAEFARLVSNPLWIVAVGKNFGVCTSAVARSWMSAVVRTGTAQDDRPLDL